MVTPCWIVNATSAESNAVFAWARALASGARFMLGNGELRAEARRSIGGQLAQVSLADMGLAVAVEVPDVAAQTADVDSCIDLAAVRSAGPRSSVRIPRAEPPEATRPRGNAAWHPG